MSNQQRQHVKAQIQAHYAYMHWVWPCEPLTVDCDYIAHQALCPAIVPCISTSVNQLHYLPFVTPFPSSKRECPRSGTCLAETFGSLWLHPVACLGVGVAVILQRSLALSLLGNKPGRLTTSFQVANLLTTGTSKALRLIAGTRRRSSNTNEISIRSIRHKLTKIN